MSHIWIWKCILSTPKVLPEDTCSWFFNSKISEFSMNYQLYQCCTNIYVTNENGSFHLKLATNKHNQIFLKILTRTGYTAYMILDQTIDVMCFHQKVLPSKWDNSNKNKKTKSSSGWCLSDCLSPTWLLQKKETKNKNSNYNVLVPDF